MQTSGSAANAEAKSTMYCSFCGKENKEVKKLVAGPTVFICDECIELCMDIVKEPEPVYIPTIIGANMLTSPEWTAKPEELVSLKEAVESGDVSLVSAESNAYFEACMLSHEYLTMATEDDRREVIATALTRQLLLLLQCAGFLGIKPENIAADIQYWADQGLRETVGNAWQELLDEAAKALPQN